MPSTKQVINISILIFLLIVFSAIALFTLKDWISSKADQISNERAMISALESRESNFANLKDNYDIVKEELPKLKSLLPEIDDLDGFVGDADSTAKDLGGAVDIKFATSSESFGQSLRKLDLTMTFSGKKEFFSKFIADLESLPYIVKINKIDIRNSSSVASAENASDTLTAAVTIFLKR